MSTKYQVVIDGKVVWKHQTDEYEGLATFPEKYRGRPQWNFDGPTPPVHLIVNGETIGIQEAIRPDVEGAILDAAPKKITGKAG